MKEGPKLNACKALKRKLKLKLRESKAFSKSIANKIPYYKFLQNWIINIIIILFINYFL